MMETYFRTGQAARQLGVSSHHLRRLCEAGLVEADLSEGKQWRLPAVEIERLKAEGVPPIPQIAKLAAHPVIDDESTEVQVVVPETASSRAVQDAFDELVITETELKKRRLERDREEVEDFFRSRHRKEMEERETIIQQQRKAALEAQRREWADSWQTYAVQTAAQAGFPEAANDVHRAAAGALSQIELPQSQTVIQMLIDAVITRTLTPYRRQHHIAGAITAAMDTLPYAARGFSTPTAWQIRAKQSAAAALAGAPESASEQELRVIAADSVKSTICAFEDAEARKCILDGMAHWQWFDANAEERDEAREAVETALGELPVGSSRERLKRAAEAVLKPLEDAIQKRNQAAEATRRAEAEAESHLRYVEEYLRNEYEFDSEYELYRTAREMCEIIKPKLTRKLLNGNLGREDVSGYIERLVDYQLD